MGVLAWLAENAVAVLALALALSEALAASKWLKSNSIVQLVVNTLKKVLSLLPGGS